MSYTIYGIRERGGKEVRYVGQTNGEIEVRLAGHLTTAESKPYGCNLPFRDWLLVHRADVEIFKIAKVETLEEARTTEKAIIALCIRLEHRLFNRRPLSLCNELQAAA